MFNLGTGLNIVAAVTFTTAFVLSIRAGVQFDLAESNRQLADRFEARCVEGFEPKLPDGIVLPPPTSPEAQPGESERTDTSTVPSSQDCAQLRKELIEAIDGTDLSDSLKRATFKKEMSAAGCPD